MKLMFFFLLKIQKSFLRAQEKRKQSQPSSNLDEDSVGAD